MAVTENIKCLYQSQIDFCACRPDMHTVRINILKSGYFVLH